MAALNPFTPALQKLSQLLQAQQGQHPAYVENHYDAWRTFWQLHGDATLKQAPFAPVVYRLLYGPIRGMNISLANTLTRNTSAQQQQQQQQTTKKRKTPADVTSEILATCATVSICHPISVVATWQLTQFRQYGRRTMVETYQRIKGIQKNVYDGVGANILLNIATHFVTEPLLNLVRTQAGSLLGRTRKPTINVDIKALIQDLENNQEDVSQEELQERLIDVFLGKSIFHFTAMLIRLIVYPLNTVRFHLEAQGSSIDNPIRYRGAFDAARAIYDEEGIQGYKGVISVPLSAGFDFAILLGAFAFSSVAIRLAETSESRKLTANVLRVAPLLL